MHSRLTLALSATALLVALLGSTPLAHALSAAVPRLSVGTPQLKNKAVTAKKIAPNAVRSAHVLNGSLLAADFKTGQLPAGAKGERGDKGDKGDKGDPGPPGVSALEIVSATSASNSGNKDWTVNCPSGKKVLGGGASLTNAPFGTVALETSIPVDDNTWGARAVEVNATTNFWALRVYAVCATVT